MVMTHTVSTFAKAVLNIFNQYLFFAPVLPGNPQFFPILGFTGTLNCAGFLHFSFNFFFTLIYREMQAVLFAGMI